MRMLRILKPSFPAHIVSSTIPTNGDLNPYGVAFVPPGFPGGGIISPGDVLVSNFNDTHNCQGQGTTIIQFTPNNPTNRVAAREPLQHSFRVLR
jgi:hypothetical protein